MKSHSELVNSLYQSLNQGRICFKEVGLGSRFLRNGEIPIPDVMTFQKSYTKPDVRIYEVKASRADLMGDVKKAKWEKYLPFCDRLFFAVHDSVKYEDVISHLPVGIMKFSEKSGKWSIVRMAPNNKRTQEIPEEVFLSLMFSTSQSVSRVERLEAEKSIMLKQEIQDLYRIRNHAIRKKMSELRDLQREQERERADLNRRVMQAVASKIGAGWMSDTSIDRIIVGITRNIESEVKNAISKRVTEVFKSLEAAQ